MVIVRSAASHIHSHTHTNELAWRCENLHEVGHVDWGTGGLLEVLVSIKDKPLGGWLQYAHAHKYIYRCVCISVMLAVLLRCTEQVRLPKLIELHTFVVIRGACCRPSAVAVVTAHSQPECKSIPHSCMQHTHTIAVLSVENELLDPPCPYSIRVN